MTEPSSRGLLQNGVYERLIDGNFADRTKIVKNSISRRVQSDEMEDKKGGKESGREKEKNRRSSDEMRLAGEE